MKDDKARTLHYDGNPRGPAAPVGESTRPASARGDARSKPHPPAPGARAEDGSVAGLECRAGRAPIVVPIEHVAQIIEYETSPLPLARRWITGVGLYDDRLVMTIGLVADTPAAAGAPERRRTKAVLLSLPDSKVAWALEVQEVVVLVRAVVLERRRGEPRTGDLPPWIGRARTNDGRSIAWIDVPAMLVDLTSPPRALA